MSIHSNNKYIFILILLYLSSSLDIKAQQNINNSKKAYSKNSIDSIINSNKDVLLFFSADWCGTCKKMVPVVEHLKTDIGKSISIIEIDYDINRTLANSMNVVEIPFIQIFIDGELRENIIGMMEERMLKEMIFNK